MLKELQNHTVAYLILAVGLVLGVILFLGAWPDRKLQQLIGSGMAGFYIIWGIVTHFRIRRITRQIVFEYLAVGLLAGLLLVLITL